MGSRDALSLKRTKIERKRGHTVLPVRTRKKRGDDRIRRQSMNEGVQIVKRGCCRTR